MFSIILILVAGFVVCLLAYYGVLYIIKLFTGCNNSEATAKLRRFVNGTPDYKLEEDFGLVNEIQENIRKIIGEKRYQQLVALNGTIITTPLIHCGFNGGLPFVAVSVFYVDDNEKRVLENIIVNIVRRYLQVYGYETSVMPVWTVRYDLNMPVLQVRYAHNDAEKMRLYICMRNQQQSVSSQNSVVTDDLEDDDLNE